MQSLPEELRNSEDARVNVVLETLKDWSDLHEKMSMHYMGLIAEYQKERREMLKYLATIAGGAAALAPQLLDHVKQPHFFYTSIGLLCLVVVISATHVLSTVENDTTYLASDLREKNSLIFRVRKPKIDFLTEGDRSVNAFVGAMSEGKEDILKDNKKPEVKSSWYRPMDYTGEFIIFLSVAGLALLALSLTAYPITWKHILLTAISTFFVINLISTFPNKVFVVLGLPIDLIKSLFRWIFHK
ncbi:hypothetical protein KW782_03655 [Candidatus Parcubacteria bacterium]|nr:hypothetical protein [Candidatus Parcubacteria bacterium]